RAAELRSVHHDEIHAGRGGGEEVNATMDMTTPAAELIAAPIADAVAQPPRRRRVLPERAQSILLALAFPVALIALWHALVVATGTRLVPTPYQVGVMMVDFVFGGINDDAFSGSVLTHLFASMGRVYGGFALAAVLGVPLGLVIGKVK